MRSGPGLVTSRAVHLDAAFGGVHIPADCFQQGRLSAPGRSEQHKTIRPQHVEIDPIGRGDQVVTGLILKRDAANLDDRQRVDIAGHRQRSAPVALSPVSSVNPRIR